MNITVAICTWNRADLLTKTLDNMLRLKTDDSFSWELIIVNNNCTDTTDDVIAQFADRLPIKRISEPTPGLSNARNAAVKNASGEYIVWTDDDVLVDENWLVAYAEAFRKYPDAAVFGGPILPFFAGSPPPWLIEEWHLVADAYAIRDFDVQECSLLVDRGIVPFGANFAIRTTEQRKYLYDDSLGLKAEKMVLGEETSVIEKILAVSEGRWVPSSKVKHVLLEGRQTTDYLMRYFEAAGKTRRLLEGLLVKNVFFEFARYVFFGILYLLGKDYMSPKLWIVFLKKKSIAKGYLHGCFIKNSL